MVRKIKIHASITLVTECVNLIAVLESLANLLLNNGNTEMWKELGVDFEDVEEVL